VDETHCEGLDDVMMVKVKVKVKNFHMGFWWLGLCQLMNRVCVWGMT